MDNGKNRTKSVLWWGRFDPQYSRNRIIIRIFEELGWHVDVFHPFASRTGLLEAYIRKPSRPDLIWSPCFRQTDIGSAAHWADAWNVPLIIDPLISAYQKEVFERAKWSPYSERAHSRKKWESSLFGRGDIVIADTPAHADFFRDTLLVRPEKIRVLYVSAESDHFKPVAFPDLAPPIEVLFFGSFLALQGVDIVVEAALRTTSCPVHWTLIGDGDLRSEMERKAAGAANISFEPWVDYALLPERISRAHILLGIFGTTPKADLVIPNKMFQSMAAGRPVITRSSRAYRETLADDDAIGWVPPGDPAALADLVLKWAQNPDTLEERGRTTRKLFDRHFSAEKIKEQLQAILDQALKN